MNNQKINIIDIGSVGGFDTPWKYHTNCIDWSLSFEPNESTILEGKNLKYNCAVWNIDGHVPFYVSGPNGTGSSLLKQNFDWVKENFENIKFESSFLSQADYLFLRKKPRSQEEGKIIELIKSVYAPKGSENLIKQKSFLLGSFNRAKSLIKNLAK